MQLKGMLKQPAQSRVRNKKRPIPPFTFGEKIYVTGTINRTNPLSQYLSSEVPEDMRKKPNRIWERDPFTDGPRQAIFLGYRKLADGWADYDGGEDGGGYYFTTDKVYSGALICIESREPEKVFLDQCQKIPGSWVDKLIESAGTDINKY